MTDAVSATVMDTMMITNDPNCGSCDEPCDDARHAHGPERNHDEGHDWSYEDGHEDDYDDGHDESHDNGYDDGCVRRCVERRVDWHGGRATLKAAQAQAQAQAPRATREFPGTSFQYPSCHSERSEESSVRRPFAPLRLTMSSHA